MSYKHLYIGMHMYNSHTWIAVMLWFRTSWLCPPACSADLMLSRIHPGGQVLPPLAFLLWTVEIMFDPCKWHGLVPGVLLASGCSVDLPPHSVTLEVVLYGPLEWAPCPLASGWFGPWGALAGNKRQRERGEWGQAIYFPGSLSPWCHIRMTVSLSGRSLSSEMSL